MNKKLKVGIIGCGGIANSKHMPGLKSVEEAEMVAFCDLEIERAEKAKAEYGTPDAKVYKDYKELLKDDSIDVVHVCTPNRSHSFISIDALRAGKHVMVEKPMAKTAAEAEEMVRVAKETGKKLTIGYQNRCRPEFPDAFCQFTNHRVSCLLLKQIQPRAIPMDVVGCCLFIVS